MIRIAAGLRTRPPFFLAYPMAARAPMLGAHGRPMRAARASGSGLRVEQRIRMVDRWSTTRIVRASQGGPSTLEVAIVWPAPLRAWITYQVLPPWPSG